MTTPIIDIGHERACRKIIGMCEKIHREFGYGAMTERDHAGIREHVARARAYRRGTLSPDQPPCDVEAAS